jgi:hypothetical protein
VPAQDIPSYRDSLDLLRRFVTTPLSARVSLEFANVLLETNEPNLLSVLATPSWPASSRTLGPPPPSCLWKIVRDVDIRQKLGEASIVMSGNLMIYTMGPACIIGADRERREILAFVGIEVDARTFQESILPVLTHLTEFVIRAGSPVAEPPAGAVAVGDRCHG